MTTEKKVVRIELEYEDGELLRATGEDANIIWKAIQGGFVMQHIHGGSYTGPQMSKVSK